MNNVQIILNEKTNGEYVNTTDTKNEFIYEYIYIVKTIGS
jgi:hypothetical protein